MATGFGYDADVRERQAAVVARCCRRCATSAARQRGARPRLDGGGPARRVLRVRRQHWDYAAGVLICREVGMSARCCRATGCCRPALGGSPSRRCSSAGQPPWTVTFSGSTSNFTRCSPSWRKGTRPAQVLLGERVDVVVALLVALLRDAAADPDVLVGVLRVGDGDRHARVALQVRRPDPPARAVERRSARLRRRPTRRRRGCCRPRAGRDVCHVRRLEDLPRALDVGHVPP